MSGTKFYIHGGGTWREVNENNGRVTGWGKIQFVYLSRGRLVVARRNSVLRGLRALLAGKPTTVRDGPRLQVISLNRKGKRDQNFFQNEPSHCCTCQHASHHNHQNNQFAADLLFDKLIKQTTKTTATQCALTLDSSETVVKNLQTEKSEKHTKTEEKDHVGANILKTGDVPRKELIIDEDDVLLVRTFIEHDKRNIFGISLVNYDADDNCKRSVFYKINPLVVVEKSSRIAQMIRPPSQSSSVSLKEFITHLGLQSIHEVSKKSKYKMRQRKSQLTLRDGNKNDSDTDKENIISTKSSNSTNKEEINLSKKSLTESKNKIRNVNKNEKKSHHYEPLKLHRYAQKKNSGVKNNSILNMTRRIQLGKKNKTEAGNTVDDSKDKSDKKVLQKTLKSRQYASNKTLLTRSKNISVSSEASSDSESLTNSENSRDISRNLRSINRNRPGPLDKNSQSTKESNNKDTIVENIKQIEKLSQSLPTRRTGNKITDLPFELSSDEDTFQKDKTSDKSKIGNGEKQSSDTTSKQQKNNPKGGGDQKSPERPNTSYKGAGRVYSRAEDEAIVSWLKSGDRASLVNGNRIWKELKPMHYQATGHHRPWQSLRNRYLRYILPALGSLAVPPGLAQKLRAAAAQGEIKRKSTSNSANNSIFKSAPVRSAWARRPKSPARSPPPPSSRTPSPATPPQITSNSLRNRKLTPTAPKSESAHQLDGAESDTSEASGVTRNLSKRALRSSGAPSPTLPTPKARARRDSLTYSELTRRFASRHRSTPQSDSSADNRGEKRPHNMSDSTDDSDDNSKTRRVTRNDSKVSPSLLSGPTTRRSKRFRSKSPERPGTRRLYNPRAV